MLPSFTLLCSALCRVHLLFFSFHSVALARVRVPLLFPSFWFLLSPSFVRRNMDAPRRTVLYGTVALSLSHTIASSWGTLLLGAFTYFGYPFRGGRDRHCKLPGSFDLSVLQPKAPVCGRARSLAPLKAILPQMWCIHPATR